MSHPEPWSVEQWGESQPYVNIESADSETVVGVYVSSELQRAEKELVFRRIAACVNACREIPVEHLERAAGFNRKALKSLLSQLACPSAQQISYVMFFDAEAKALPIYAVETNWFMPVPDDLQPFQSSEQQFTE